MAGVLRRDEGPARKGHNVVKDVQAARTVRHVANPDRGQRLEIGNAIQHPAVSMQRDYGYVVHHPLRGPMPAIAGWKTTSRPYGLTSVLYAVRPDRGYFTLSQARRITIAADGYSEFALRRRRKLPVPLRHSGPDRPRPRGAAWLCSQPPAQAHDRDGECRMSKVKCRRNVDLGNTE